MMLQMTDLWKAAEIGKLWQLWDAHFRKDTDVTSKPSGPSTYTMALPKRRIQV